MICPSYDMATNLLEQFRAPCPTSSLRELTNQVASECAEHGEPTLLLDDTGESLAGKRVVISSDGGRTRTREATGGVTKPVTSGTLLRGGNRSCSSSKYSTTRGDCVSIIYRSMAAGFPIPTT